MDIDKYIDAMRFEYGKFMLSKKRIYLDTKYWIFLKEVVLNKKDGIYKDIYNTLYDLVVQNIVICPVSWHVLEEFVFRTDDDAIRKICFDLIDKFSLGYCFVSPLTIPGQELVNYLVNMKRRKSGEPLLNMTKYVWTKIPFLWGEYYPSGRYAIPYLEYLSKIDSYNLFKRYPIDTNKQLYVKLAINLNIGKELNKKWNSFDELFIIELNGHLDVLEKDIINVLIYLRENEYGVHIDPIEIIKSNEHRELRKMIVNGFANKETSTELSSMYIRSMIDAHIRYERLQRYRPNDIIDFHHASLALPYCNYFFTEHKLNYLLTEKSKMNRKYAAIVKSKEHEVLESLITLRDNE